MDRVQIKSTLTDIVKKYVKTEINSDEVQKRLMEEIDPEDIYEIEDDMVITDCYFALKHLKESGYETLFVEIKYFLECFSGEREYSLEEKNKMIRKM